MYNGHTVAFTIVYITVNGRKGLSMTTRRTSQIAVLICLILFAALFGPRTAFAQTIAIGNQLDADEVIANDVVMTGDEIRLSGVVEGNAFLVGRSITVDGAVEGSLFAIGQRVVIDGQVRDSAYTIALVSQLGGEATIGQNFYFLGLSLGSSRGSQVGRDLYALSLGAQIQGSVGRDTKLIAGLVQFLDLFMDLSLGPAPQALRVGQMLGGRAPGLGQFILPGGGVVDLVGQSTVASQTDPEPADQNAAMGVWFQDRLREFIPLLIIGLIAYWLMRKRLEGSATALKTRPLAALGIGLVGLSLAGAMLGAFILVFILILMFGIWLGTISLWNVAWLFWSVAFPFTALVMALFLIFLNQGTKVIVMYALTTYLVDRFAPGAGRYRWLLLILGLVVFIFVRAIPILGWVLGVLATAWGIGGAWLMWRGRKQAAAPAAVDVLPVDVAADVAVEEQAAADTTAESTMGGADI